MIFKTILESRLCVDDALPLHQTYRGSPQKTEQYNLKYPAAYHPADVLEVWLEVGVQVSISVCQRDGTVMRS